MTYNHWILSGYFGNCFLLEIVKVTACPIVSYNVSIPLIMFAKKPPVVPGLADQVSCFAPYYVIYYDVGTLALT
jgi:hypothetical protein